MEKCLIGSLLLDKDQIKNLLTLGFTPNNLFFNITKKYYLSILNLINNNMFVDPILVLNQMLIDEQEVTEEDEILLFEMGNHVPSPDHASSYAMQLIKWTIMDNDG